LSWDPYAALGVPRASSAEEIRKAYRKLAKELHPDVRPNDKASAERFKRVTAAFNLLTDENLRGRFDRGEIDENGQPRSPFGAGFGGGSPFSGGGARPGQGGFEFGGGIDLGDIFDGLFGGGAGARPGGPRPQPGPPPKGANIAYEHLVSFTDAAKLEPQRITLRDGKTVEFKLPPGVVSGQQIRIPGKGQTGPGGNGDAMVTLKLGKHPFYDRDGDNIRLDLPISLKEAIAGAKVKVPTIDGPVMLSVPAGAQSGTTMRIKGRGFAKKGGERGDQLVTLQIRLPSDLGKLAALAEALPDDPSLRAELGV